MVSSRIQVYCCDSHATDIEHFWPKATYPERMFQWPNFLLCCAECGRFKGARFPVEDGNPLLVDPTRDDPWQHLDFDPATGVIVPRFNVSTNAEDRKGTETVRVLQLDRREAANDGYLKTWRRLARLVEGVLDQGIPELSLFLDALADADDHGLLGWCASGTGQRVRPFPSLRQQFPEAWAEFTQRFA